MRAALRGWACAGLLVAGLAPRPLAAQDSQFGIPGLGTPGRWESVRARSTGGAFGPFDALSPLVEASLTDLPRLAAGVTGATSWRTAETGTVNASLRASRFPALVVAGPVARGLIVAGGFSTYLDKSFGVRTQHTVDLRGQRVPVTDEITSDGAVTDLRLAVAARPHRHVAVGVAIHGLTGSTRVAATRTFDDTSYRTSTARDEIAYGGFGGSASALVDLSRDLRIAAWARSDTKLKADIRGRALSTADLPFAYGGGARWRLGTDATVAGAVAWRAWAGADANAHDTFSWSVGAELASTDTPLRLGVRGGTLPFGPGGAAAPTEFAIAAGLGRAFSGGRGRLDMGLERLERKGAGLTERTWTLLLGLSVRP